MKNEERAEQMAQVLEEQAASGLSKKAFCAERGIHPAKFYYWQRRLQAPESSPTTVAGFTELPVRTLPELEVRLPNGQWIEVRTGSARALGLLLEAISQR